MAGENSTPAKRPYTQRENRLRSEFLAAAYPGARILINPRLGAEAIDVGSAAAGGRPARGSQVSQMYADAAIVLPNQVLLWEFKIVLDGRAVGQLLEYADAWPDSPDYNQYRNLPVSLHICATAARRSALRVAKRLGIEVVFYAPAWAVQMAESWYPQLSRPIVGGSYSESG